MKTILLILILLSVLGTQALRIRDEDDVADVTDVDVSDDVKVEADSKETKKEDDKPVTIVDAKNPT